MKRFIDLRGQGTGMRFAWYDTVKDIFERHSNEYAWNTWEEFVDDHEGNDLLRYKCLCPEWAFIKVEEDDDEILPPYFSIKLPKPYRRGSIDVSEAKQNSIKTIKVLNDN